MTDDTIFLPVPHIMNEKMIEGAIKAGAKNQEEAEKIFRGILSSIKFEEFITISTEENDGDRLGKEIKDPDLGQLVNISKDTEEAIRFLDEADYTITPIEPSEKMLKAAQAILSKHSLNEIKKAYMLMVKAKPGVY